MGRTLDDVLASLPEDRVNDVRRRTTSLRAQAEALLALRSSVAAVTTETGWMSDVSIEDSGRISVQAARFMLELQKHLAMVGGRLQASIDIPGHPVMSLEDLVDAASWANPSLSDLDIPEIRQAL